VYIFWLGIAHSLILNSVPDVQCQSVLISSPVVSPLSPLFLSICHPTAKYSIVSKNKPHLFYMPELD
jgi:hypothetical protein